MHVACELAVRRLGPERKQEVAEPPVSTPRARLTVTRILRAPRSIGQMIFRRAVGNGMAQRLILRQLVGIHMAGVQEAEMRGIDLPLERLQVIAIALDEAHPEDRKST